MREIVTPENNCSETTYGDIARVYGIQVGPEGEIDRTALAKAVFESPERLVELGIEYMAAIEILGALCYPAA